MQGYKKYKTVLLKGKKRTIYIKASSQSSRPRRYIKSRGKMMLFSKYVKGGQLEKPKRSSTSSDELLQSSEENVKYNTYDNNNIIVNENGITFAHYITPYNIINIRLGRDIVKTRPKKLIRPNVTYKDIELISADQQSRPHKLDLHNIHSYEAYRHKGNDFFYRLSSHTPNETITLVHLPAKQASPSEYEKARNLWKAKSRSTAIANVTARSNLEKRSPEIQIFPSVRNRLSPDIRGRFISRFR